MTESSKRLLLPKVVICQDRMMQAWDWFLNEINPRPTKCDTFCIFDSKRWGKESAIGSLEPREPFTTELAVLYVVSQLGDIDTILGMMVRRVASDLSLYTDKLDSGIKNLIENPTRFRWALSEHLAFWVDLAVISKSEESVCFARSLPNFKPEDKGPDGVSIVMNIEEETTGRVEVHSVKNSIQNPASLIATGQLKQKGQAANHKKLLDEFWYFSHEGTGLIPLDRLLDQVCGKLGFSPQQNIRMAMLSDCVYNATVVADERYARVQLFQGYEHIVPDRSRRVATYVGASNWQQFAELTRQCVIGILGQAGVL